MIFTFRLRQKKKGRIVSRTEDVLLILGTTERCSVFRQIITLLPSFLSLQGEHVLKSNHSCGLPFKLNKTNSKHFPNKGIFQLRAMKPLVVAHSQAVLSLGTNRISVITPSSSSSSSLLPLSSSSSAAFSLISASFSSERRKKQHHHWVCVHWRCWRRKTHLRRF